MNSPAVRVDRPGRLVARYSSSPGVSGGRVFEEDNDVLGGARMGTAILLSAMATVYSQPRLRSLRCAQSTRVYFPRLR